MSIRITFLCTDCGLRVPRHREAEAVAHRSTTGHRRTIALAIDRAHDRANHKANRQARALAQNSTADLDARLAAMFGGAQ